MPVYSSSLATDDHATNLMETSVVTLDFDPGAANSELTSTQRFALQCGLRQRIEREISFAVIDDTGEKSARVTWGGFPAGAELRLPGPARQRRAAVQRGVAGATC